MAIRGDGSLWAWGANSSGQLGDGSPRRNEDGSALLRLEPVKIMDGVARVSAGSTRTMAVTDDGGLYSWGLHLVGVIAPNVYIPDNNIPVRILGLDDVIDVSVDTSEAVAIRSDGSLWARVWEDEAQLVENVLAISVGGFRFDGHVLAVTDDGNLWTWGGRWNEGSELEMIMSNILMP